MTSRRASGRVPPSRRIAAYWKLGHQEGYVRQLVMRFLRDSAGATGIEYALIAAGVSIAIVGAVNTLGTNLNTLYGNVSTAMK